MGDDPISASDRIKMVIDQINAAPLPPASLGWKQIAADVKLTLVRKLANTSDETIADITDVLRLDPNNAIAYYLRGYWRHKRGEYEQAVADYTEVLRRRQYLE